MVKNIFTAASTALCLLSTSVEANQSLKLKPVPVLWSITVGEAHYYPGNKPIEIPTSVPEWGCSATMIGKGSNDKGQPTEEVWLVCMITNNTEIHITTMVSCLANEPSTDSEMLFIQNGWGEDRKSAMVLIRCLEVPELAKN